MSKEPEWLNKSETWEEVDARIPPYTVDRILGEYKNGFGEWVKFPDTETTMSNSCSWCRVRFTEEAPFCPQCGAPSEIDNSVAAQMKAQMMLAQILEASAPRFNAGGPPPARFRQVTWRV